MGFVTLATLFACFLFWGCVIAFFAHWAWLIAALKVFLIIIVALLIAAAAIYFTKKFLQK